MSRIGNSQALITHKINDGIFHHRPSDGYVNATELCRAANKDWYDYYRLDRTQLFLKELKNSLNTVSDRILELVESKRGKNGGTYIHPRIAINLAQWLSPEFDVFVSGLVFEWMSGKDVRLPKMRPPIRSVEELMIRSDCKETRKCLTAMLISLGCGQGQIINMTNQIYRGLFGKTAKELRAERGFPDKANIREYLTSGEWYLVQMFEEKATIALEIASLDGKKVSSGEIARYVREAAERVVSRRIQTELTLLK